MVLPTDDLGVVLVLQRRSPGIVHAFRIEDGGHRVAPLPAVGQQGETEVGEESTNAFGHGFASSPTGFVRFLFQVTQRGSPPHGEVDGRCPRCLVVVALLERRDHVEVVAWIGVALLVNRLDAFHAVFIQGNGGDAGGSSRAFLGPHHDGFGLPCSRMNGHATHRGDAVENEGDTVAFAHLSDGFSILRDAAAGLIVADEQGFVAATFELLFKFVQVKRPAPLVLQVLHVAELTANIRDSLAELAVGGDQDEIVVAEAVGDDHLHGGGAATGDDHDLVAVLAGPGLSFHLGRRG